MGFMLGDNFYQKGVRSVTDSQFQSKFEKPYAPLGIPLYPALGNHDYGYGRKGVQAQVDYSKRSSSWNMKGRYYTVEEGDFKVIVLDTQVFTRDEKQRQWFDRELAKDRKKWQIVIGHHPIYAYGGHGNHKGLIKKLLPKLCQRADVYIAGHEHNLQALTAPCGLPLLVAGAAAKLRRTYKGKLSDFAKVSLGFLHSRVSKKEMHFDYFDHKGKVLYSRLIKNNFLTN